MNQVVRCQVSGVGVQGLCVGDPRSEVVLR